MRTAARENSVKPTFKWNSKFETQTALTLLSPEEFPELPNCTKFSAIYTLSSCVA